jgi:hypothetical protein
MASHLRSKGLNVLGFIALLALLGIVAAIQGRKENTLKEEGAAKLGGARIGLDMTFDQLRAVMQSEPAIAELKDSSSVTTNARVASWYVNLVTATFVVGPDKHITGDDYPIGITVHAPYSGALEGHYLVGDCQSLQSRFRNSESKVFSCENFSGGQIENISVRNPRWRYHSF